MSDKFEEGVAAVMAREFAGFEALLDCSRLTAGASLETYRLKVLIGGVECFYALRRSPLGGTDTGDVAGIGLDAEARLLQLMGQAGIPEPEIYYVLREEDGLGGGFFMQWLDGETLGSRIVRSEQLAVVRPQLARQCGEILARIHNIDWRTEGLDQHLMQLTPEQLVHESWNYYQELGLAEPMLDYTARWLLQNLPQNPQINLVHGDFRNGNLMVTEAGITAVLDWEIAHLGDPVRDLGWLCVNSWRFGNTQLPVGGFGHIEDLLAGYNAVAKVAVTHEQLHYWQVFGSFWWAIACLRMAQSWRSGDNPSVERPAIGRRSSEAQMDCVNLLIPGDFVLPTGANEAAMETQLPVLDELLSSVETFLREEVSASADPRLAFLSRVAANSIATARREADYGTELAQAEATRLQQLLNATGDALSLRRQLAVALRQGLALDAPGLAEHMRQTVAGQLAIDQPRYGALQVAASRQGESINE
ncbi:phosphotransferase family protein [Halieaceae bacterium IMCC14734]|uniref:Phosphotransferase family protein n=1 Tax=Candidatus Litorirhabdus singularis TaxID=2518993 RepID=A0ABT3TIV1_9GAMM|nr:phosphotransferase family protein [Candidatus Litorirhabdus singularis]MCX2982194.1 phosphotransferase family protein [Candidatus Litorirhabdus singularis]